MRAKLMENAEFLFPSYGNLSTCEHQCIERGWFNDFQWNCEDPSDEHAPFSESPTNNRSLCLDALRMCLLVCFCPSLSDEVKVFSQLFLDLRSISSSFFLLQFELRRSKTIVSSLSVDWHMSVEKKCCSALFPNERVTIFQFERIWMNIRGTLFEIFSLFFPWNSSVVESIVSIVIVRCNLIRTLQLFFDKSRPTGRSRWTSNVNRRNGYPDEDSVGLSSREEQTTRRFIDDLCDDFVWTLSLLLTNLIRFSIVRRLTVSPYFRREIWSRVRSQWTTKTSYSIQLSFIWSSKVSDERVPFGMIDSTNSNSNVFESFSSRSKRSELHFF